MSNAKFDELLVKIKRLAVEAKSEEDWTFLFKELKSYAKLNPVGYSFKIQGTIATIFGLISGVLLYLSKDSSPTQNEVLVYCSPLIITIALVGYICHKHDNVSSVSDLIFYKDVLWDNGLSEIEVDKHIQHKILAKQFGDFNRGDQDRTIEAWLEGNHEGSEHSFKYNLYHFRYIVVTYETVRVGKTTTIRRKETPHHRYGMVVDFPFCSDFAITSGSSNREFKYQWETSSSEFNKVYNCHTDNEQDIARFLSPSVVLALTNFDCFSSMRWELTNGKLCISFNDELINIERTHGIDKPLEFESEIKGKLHLKEINELKNLVHKLMTNSDNNFSRRS